MHQWLCPMCGCLQTLPKLLAEFSKRALNPLRTVGHTLMPWSRCTHWGHVQLAEGYLHYLQAMPRRA